MPVWDSMEKTDRPFYLGVFSLSVANLRTRVHMFSDSQTSLAADWSFQRKIFDQTSTSVYQTVCCSGDLESRTSPTTPTAYEPFRTWAWVSPAEHLKQLARWKILSVPFRCCHQLAPPLYTECKAREKVWQQTASIVVFRQFC